METVLDVSRYSKVHRLVRENFKRDARVSLCDLFINPLPTPKCLGIIKGILVDFFLLFLEWYLRFFVWFLLSCLSFYFLNLGPLFGFVFGICPRGLFGELIWVPVCSSYLGSFNVSFWVILGSTLLGTFELSIEDLLVCFRWIILNSFRGYVCSAFWVFVKSSNILAWCYLLPEN